ncbi:MAG: cell division protein FtsL [Comamonas sp.]|nr:cell division protein FtsL [Comamonas sp.]
MLRIQLLLLLAVIASALYLVHTQYESRRLFTELDRAIAQGRQLETERQRLQVEKRAQSAPSRIEHLAQTQGLQPVTPALTHYVRDDRGIGGTGAPGEP